MMNKFTKTANFVFRAFVAAAFGLSAAVVAAGASIIAKTANGVENADAVMAALANADVSPVLGFAKVLPMVLILASVLSCVAFKCAGTAKSIVRTLVLLASTGLASLGSFLFGCADTAVRVVQGTASAEEAAVVQPMIDAFAENGVAGTASEGFIVLGIAAAVLVTAVLAVLVITSVISVVKTLRTNELAACAA